MAVLIDFQPGGYKFIKGPFQYSAGVVALPGHRIERVRFANPLPLQEGFSRISEFLQSRDRPLTAFCACELRSPAPFDDDGFVAFNRQYAAVLEQWGLLAFGDNPVARSNVCPEIDPPAEPGFHAFCYTVRDAAAPPSFVAAGSGESQEGNATYAERTIARGDTSPAGMLEKARYVLGVMEARMQALGFTWADTTGVQVYTVFDIFPFLADEIIRRGAGRHGVTWQFARPPVVGLDFEMDCRGLNRESVI